MSPREKTGEDKDEDYQVLTTNLSSLNLKSNEKDTSDSVFSNEKCITWFHEYTGADEPDTLCPEGMEKFCKDIGVELEDIVMLVLAWKMDAKQMGFFTAKEWSRGLQNLQCDSCEKLQNKLECLRTLLNDPLVFKSVYRYAYDFARDKDQLNMDIETGKALLQLLLGKHWPLCGMFYQYLDQSNYKVVNKDQWLTILEFSTSITPDLSNYDEDAAWPVLLDEFVEWLKAKPKEYEI